MGDGGGGGHVRGRLGGAVVVPLVDAVLQQLSILLHALELFHRDEVVVYALALPVQGFTGGALRKEVRGSGH